MHARVRELVDSVTRFHRCQIAVKLEYYAYCIEHEDGSVESKTNCGTNHVRRHKVSQGHLWQRRRENECWPRVICQLWSRRGRFYVGVDYRWTLWFDLAESGIEPASGLSTLLASYHDQNWASVFTEWEWKRVLQGRVRNSTEHVFIRLTLYNQLLDYTRFFRFSSTKQRKEWADLLNQHGPSTNWKQSVLNLSHNTGTALRSLSNTLSRQKRRLVDNQHALVSMIKKLRIWCFWVYLTALNRTALTRAAFSRSTFSGAALLIVSALVGSRSLTIATGTGWPVDTGLIFKIILSLKWWAIWRTPGFLYYWKKAFNKK